MAGPAGEPPTEGPRKVVREKGQALVSAVRAVRESADPKIGELVAAESVVEAESTTRTGSCLAG
jgi:hypothetical protein